MKLLVAALVIVLVACRVSAKTKCVSCGLLNEATRCADPFSKANREDLKIECNYGCAKTKTDTIGGLITVQRGCALIKMAPACDVSEVAGISKTWICHCDGEYCNSAPKMALPFAGLVMALVATLYTVL